MLLCYVTSLALKISLCMKYFIHRNVDAPPPRKRRARACRPVRPSPKDGPAFWTIPIQN
jgi:hypothetical protein